MKNYCSRLIHLVLLGLLLLSTSCSTAPPEIPSLPAPSSTAPPSTQTQLPPPTTTETATPNPTATHTPGPEAAKILSTTLQQPGTWDFQLPYADPGAPELVAADAGGYRLDPDFQVASIELLYVWIGIGDSVKEYQRIERRGASYWRFDTEVSTDAVTRLVQSISSLHPQPSVVNVTTHTDDYPFWTIELTDEQGSHVLLYSSSNAPNFVPWNVIYNGKIYAQFDGQIAAALPALFTITEGQTMASVEWKAWEEGYLTVTNIEPPPDQFSSGFSGLLPMSRYFHYTADPEKGELRGNLYAFTWSEGLAAEVVGPLTKLEKIEIDLEDGRAIACTYEIIQSLPDSSSFSFVCPVGLPGENAAYRYPFRMTFANQVNPTYVLSGELFGYWHKGLAVSAVPYPEEIGEILAAVPEVQDMLSDHLVFVTRSVAAVDPAIGLLDHHWEADVTLLGQAQVGRRILPYSVTIQVEIEDSKLVHWDLDRAELQALLQDALAQAITRRFLEGDPDLVLNLYYGEVSDDPIVPEEKLQSCAGLPVVSQQAAPHQSLPAPGLPFRSFSFNQQWSIYSAQFLLVESGLRVNNFHISPSSPKDALWIPLLPPELQAQDMPFVRRISTEYDSLGVNIYWDMDASLAGDELYYAMFETWNVTKDTEYHGITLHQGMLAITPDGRLELVRCDAP